MDVRAMQIDFLAADGHKWLLGPEGCGVFFCRKELLTTLHPEIGWLNFIHALDFSSLESQLHSDARRFECGALNVGGVLALGAAVQLILELGTGLIEARVLGLTGQLCEGLQRKGYGVVSSRRPGESSGIVAFTSPSGEHQRILSDLTKQKIILVVREGRLRASPHFYNSPEQIERLVAALP